MRRLPLIPIAAQRTELDALARTAELKGVRRMTRKQKRLAVIAGLGVVLALAATLILVALRDQIVFFYSPTEVHDARGRGRARRSGWAGWSRTGRWVRDRRHQRLRRDRRRRPRSRRSYVGILPDLFREGQGVVAEGSLTPRGTFAASTVLAKHDENYMPKEVVEALKASGEWQRGGGAVSSRPSPRFAPPLP